MPPRIRATIPADKATASQDLTPGVAPHEKTETTHYSVVDQAGNAASVTYTINGLFGALVIPGRAGFFLNDEMDDFTTPNWACRTCSAWSRARPTRSRRPSGRCRPMAPTLVTKDGKIFLVLGSPGGSRIITITLETALNIIDYGMEPQEAVDAPRLHHQWLPDEVDLEPWAVSPDSAKLLTGHGVQAGAANARGGPPN